MVSSTLGGTDSFAVGRTTVKCGAAPNVAYPVLFLPILFTLETKAYDSSVKAVKHSGITKSTIALPIET